MQNHAGSVKNSTVTYYQKTELGTLPLKAELHPSPRYQKSERQNLKGTCDSLGILLL